jgi:hypothetical protein
MSGNYLRQSTASQSRAIGPFLDDTDFKTAETGLTIANTDIKLVVNGGASANKNSGGGTHRVNGVYGVTFDATDTATVGEIQVSVVVAGALPVFDKFVVLEEAVYDALFAASAPGYLQPTTAGRTLDVSAGGEAGIDWANIGSPTTAVNLSGTNIDTDQVVASVSGAVGSVTGAVGSVTGAVGSVTGNVGGSVGSVASGGISEASFATTAGSFAPLGIVDQGTAQSATGTTLVLRSAAAFANDELIGATIVITGGSAGVGQAREITDYVSSSDTATVDAWTTTPSGTITYKIFAGPPAAAAGIAALADAVWDEALSGHAVSGSAGEALSAAGTAGDPWTTALPGAYGSGTAGKIIGDNINATISSRAAASVLGAAVGASISADIAAVKTQTAAIETDTQDIQSRIPAALVSGRIDASVGAMAANVMTAAAAAADLTTELQSGLATASAVSTLQTSVDDLPTNAELSTALAAADDAVLARLGSPAGASVSADIAAAKADTAAIKAKTDGLTFTVTGKVDANITHVIADPVQANGATDTNWGGAP